MTKSVIPVMRERRLLPGIEGSPLSSFRREMDRLLDQFSGSFGLLSLSDQGGLVPRVNVAETDGEVELTVELPGLEQKDVDVTLADDILTIRGEKSAEEEEKGKQFRVMERRYGSFARSFEVPAGLEPSAVKATIEKGVLTVRFPKPPAAPVRKIEIKAAA